MDVTEHVCGLEVTLDTASADDPEGAHSVSADGVYPASAGDVGQPVSAGEVDEGMEEAQRPIVRRRA
eukprot:547978-Amphidinium_carterae.1